MLPDSAFPGPLPLNRKDSLELLARLDEFGSANGTFVSFVMIPLEARIGDWRFAGASESLADAVRRVDEFAAAMKLSHPTGRGFLRSLFEPMTWVNKWNYPQQCPINGIGEVHRMILCVRGDAPNDDIGGCILEIPSLSGSTYEGRLPETQYPQEWREAAVHWFLENGTERFGEPLPELETAIAEQSSPTDWERWSLHWDEFESWDDLL